MEAAIKNYSDEELVRLADFRNDPILNLFADRLKENIRDGERVWELENEIDALDEVVCRAEDKAKLLSDLLIDVKAMLEKLPSSQELEEIIECIKDDIP